MLILTRKNQESIIINDDIKILGIYEKTVKIGVDAPKEIDIHREEIYLKIQRGVK